MPPTGCVSDAVKAQLEASDEVLAVLLVLVRERAREQPVDLSVEVARATLLIIAPKCSLPLIAALLATTLSASKGGIAAKFS